MIMAVVKNLFDLHRIPNRTDAKGLVPFRDLGGANPWVELALENRLAVGRLPTGLFTSPKSYIYSLTTWFQLG